MPIPDTTKTHRLRENAAAADLHLPATDLADITSAADAIDRPNQPAAISA